MTSENTTARLDGLDLARFFAFVGMVIVNFKIAMGPTNSGGGWLDWLTVSLEGRAAASFVVLAGVGLGLASMRSGFDKVSFITVKRALFLLVLGLFNSLIFDADILHYYAFYFLFGVFCLKLSLRWLGVLIVLVNIVFWGMLIVLDYGTGWNWINFSYADFWTPVGFIRNLFFNGWHPVFPWLSFLLFGIGLARLPLVQKRIQNWMIVLGAAAVLEAEVASLLLSNHLADGDADLLAMFGTSPIPPAPLYIIAGMGAASLVIGLSLRVSGWLEKAGILRAFTHAGRQTLTLYIAHILLGMGLLQELGMLGGQSLETAVFAAMLFCLLAMLYAWLWAKIFKRGPIETLMRRIAG